jgi:hypothetical protein
MYILDKLIFCSLFVFKTFSGRNSEIEGQTDRFCFLVGVLHFSYTLITFCPPWQRVKPLVLWLRVILESHIVTSSSEVHFWEVSGDWCSRF